MMSSVKSLNSAPPDNAKFFTVQGKIFLGPASPKTLKKNKVVKENIFLADTTGTITIHIREPVLNNVTDRCSYELMHNCLRKFMGQMFLTTSSTKLTKVNDLADVSEEHVFSSGMITLKVNRFEEIGDVNTFLSCNKLKKKIQDLDMRKGTV